MLDINLFRAEKGGNPDLVRESQRRRYADVALVDKVRGAPPSPARGSSPYRVFFAWRRIAGRLCRAASCGRVAPASDRTAHVRRKSRARAPSRAVLIPCRPPCGRAQVIEVDLEWRQLQFKVDNLRADYGKVNKEVAAKKKAKEDADDLIAKAKGIDADIKVAAGWRACILFPHSHQRTVVHAAHAPGRDWL